MKKAPKHDWRGFLSCIGKSYCLHCGLVALNNPATRAQICRGDK